MAIDFDKLFSDISKMKVAVIGDVMLDTYWWGNVERISPEAPVPVVAVNKREKRIGGAGNVALNVQALGTNVAILTILGDDEDGAQLKCLLQDNNIDTRFILESKKRITTNKIRIISRNQQMMRLDAEHTEDIDETDETKLQNQIEKYILSEKPDVVILEDYNKGILTKNIIENTIELCNKNNIPITVDPKRKNFFSYKNATLFKPNLHEVFTSLNLIPGEVSIDLLSDIHSKLKENLDHSISMITLSEKGIFYQEKNDKNIIPSHRRNIADVSGAGDTVIAVASLIYASTKNIQLATEVANIAGGIVCEEVGTAAINKEKLLRECKELIADLS
ncbi:carbohydrate kinase [Ginsengibacter hankyongi]|uniref:Carbohydrate kinase n=1 Tax=Ginsengibacter hankyongi TaxID=2607284 RepID=A0A5J5IG82_9BACT|nr:PfkB family carbohydrate kinase [Ginsengibacter hankyongi]KAA9039280.1 carbohydrate kinase [Ginsengibacter hankyongi]